MGDVTGPISSLPGSSHALPDGAVCDEHPRRKAVARIQGETDSFGCEMWDVCDQCLKGIRADNAERRIGACDWCKGEATDLRPARDYDEGMAGRIYDVCGACVKRRNDEAAEELARYDDDGYLDWEDDGDEEDREGDFCKDDDFIPAPQIGSGLTINDSKGHRHIDSEGCWCRPQRSHTETTKHVVLIHKCRSTNPDSNPTKDR
jgi:hypothetical protein